MPVHLEITNRTRRPMQHAWLKRALGRILALVGVDEGSWTIILVRDAEMKRLHARTMNIPTTTDVLTFDLRDSIRRTREGSPLELDSVLCVDEAQRRVTESNHPLRNELLLYALHSLLHVQGYDDTTPRKAAAMHRREDELLVALGVGAVYGATGARAKN
jgi:probable rRNA maturation factor